MSSPEKKKIPWLKLGVVAVVVVAGGLLLLRGVKPAEVIEAVMTRIRAAGPVAFFVAMAVLPAVGMPVLAFCLTVAGAFGNELGLTTVVLLSLLALTVNFLLAYFLSRYALRPVLERLLTAFGYKVPEVESGDAADLVIILRLTPGVPFFIQNYLAGLGGVAFGRYVFISCVIVWPFNAAVILFGDALLHGKGKVALIAISLLVAASAATHMARRHYGRKKPAA